MISIQMDSTSVFCAILALLAVLSTSKSSPITMSITGVPYSETDGSSTQGADLTSAEGVVTKDYSSRCSRFYDISTSIAPRWLKPCRDNEPANLFPKLMAHHLTSAADFYEALKEIYLITLRGAKEIYKSAATIKEDLTEETNGPLRGSIWDADVAAASLESIHQFARVKLEDSNGTLPMILHANVVANYERLAFVSEILGKVISTSGGQHELDDLDEHLDRTMCQLHVISFVADQLGHLDAQSSLSSSSSVPSTPFEQCQLINDDTATRIAQYQGPSVDTVEARKNIFRYFVAKTATVVAASLASDFGAMMKSVESTLTSSTDGLMSTASMDSSTEAIVVTATAS